MFLSIWVVKRGILEYLPAWKKNRKSTSGEIWRSQTRLNLRQFDVSNMSVAMLEQIRQVDKVFMKNFILDKKIFEFLKIF